MIRPLSTIVILSILVISCNSNEKKVPVTDTDVATTFIRDILDNNIDEASQFVLKDTVNMDYFESFKQAYKKKDKAELDKFKSADIIINEYSNVSDSITIINYSNSYKKASKNTLKLVRVNGKWLIDFKYTFSGNM
jgi:hypothetical protein